MPVVVPGQPHIGSAAPHWVVSVQFLWQVHIPTPAPPHAQVKPCGQSFATSVRHVSTPPSVLAPPFPEAPVVPATPVVPPAPVVPAAPPSDAGVTEPHDEKATAPSATTQANNTRATKLERIRSWYAAAVVA